MNENFEHNSESSGHERAEPKMSPIVISLGALFGTVLLSMLIVGLALAYFSRAHENVPRVMTEPARPPAAGPALDASQADDQKQLRRHQEKLLSEYQWIDQKAGIARIPIRRAMEITAQKLAVNKPQSSQGGGGHE